MRMCLWYCKIFASKKFPERCKVTFESKHSAVRCRHRGGMESSRFGVLRIFQIIINDLPYFTNFSFSLDFFFIFTFVEIFGPRENDAILSIYWKFTTNIPTSRTAETPYPLVLPPAVLSKVTVTIGFGFCDFSFTVWLRQRLSAMTTIRRSIPGVRRTKPLKPGKVLLNQP